jgi:histidinol-phosphatase
VKGIPIWATLIALELDAELVVGVASAPALGRRWWAARGRGAFADGHPITVSSVATLEDAHLAYSDVGSFYDHGSGDALVALSRRAWRARGLGDFWMHVLVAEGAFDVAVEPVVSLWDLAAVQVIVEEAGGRFTSLDGVAQAGAAACSTNGVLHDEVLAAFAR